MLGFMTKGPAPRGDDPLRAPRSALAWFRNLPADDVMDRQRRAMLAFDAMRQSCGGVDRDRAAAIELLDAAFEHDRRRLLAQYLEGLDRGAAMSDRLWQAIHEMNRGFIYAFGTVLDNALLEPGSVRWRSLLPLLIARLIRCHGDSARLRAFRYQRPIPANWIALHELYRRSVELGLQRAPLIGAMGSDERRLTVEEEYVYALLIDRIDAGNMAPPDFERAAKAMRGWCRDLFLAPAPRTPGCLAVDFAGRTGFASAARIEPRPTVRYFDPVPIRARLATAIASATTSAPGETPTGAAFRVAVLEKLRFALETAPGTELRRVRRVGVNAPAALRIGLAPICQSLTAAGDHSYELGRRRQDPHTGPLSLEPEAPQVGVRLAGNMADALADLDRIRMQIGAPVGSLDNDLRLGVQRAGGEAHAELPHECTVVDRSATGLRLQIAGVGVEVVAVGTLVAVRPPDAADWTLGVVRRLRALAKNRIEAGVSTFDERAVLAMLQTRRAVSAEMQVFVDGIDMTALGETFSSVYLPQPPKRRTWALDGTLVLPTAHYRAGRRVFLSARGIAQSVNLGERVEQHGDWVRTTVNPACEPASAREAA